MIVVFSGLDGSGKTTQIEILKRKFTAKKMRCKVLWARGGYTPGFEFVKKLLRKIIGKRLAPQGAIVERRAQLNRPFVQNLWLFVAIFDLILFWVVYTRILSMLGFIIICDRYIDDTLLDFRRNFSNSNFERSLIWRLLNYLIPPADECFLFWVPISVSEERSLEKGEPFPDDRDTLEWRLNAYMDETTFASEKYIKIDGQISVEEIAEFVSSKIARKLRVR